MAEIRRVIVRVGGVTYVGLDRIDRGHHLRRGPLRVGRCASRSTGVVGMVDVRVRVDARESRLRVRVVMRSVMRVTGHVLRLAGIMCRDFGDSREVGIIRVHRVSLR